HVIEQRNAENFPTFFQPQGYLPVLVRGFQLAAWMVMRNDQRYCPRFNSRREYLSRVHHGSVDQTDRHDMNTDYLVRPVERNGEEVFLFACAEMGDEGVQIGRRSNCRAHRRVV